MTTSVASSPVTAFFEGDADFWSDVYGHEDAFGATIRRRHARARAWIDDLKLPLSTDVLEVGSGAGLLSVALAKRGLAVTAVDAAPAMVTATRRHAADAGVSERLTAALGDVHHLTFEPATFELAIALGVLPWLDAPATAVAEMSRVLRPNGWLIISADNRQSLVHLLDPLRNPSLAPLKRAISRRLRRQTSQCEPRADRWKAVDRMLGDAGLRVMAHTTCGFGPLTLFHRRVMPERLSSDLDRRLQALADRRVASIHALGWHHMVLARKAAAGA
jgi:ubiquinone/menaquinone biosynthesis C-methylase UbiE